MKQDYRHRTFFKIALGAGITIAGAGASDGLTDVLLKLSS